MTTVGAEKLTFELVQDFPGLPDGNPPRVTVRDRDGEVLTRWDVRHAHGIWVDSRGDVYLGLTTSQSVDKYVRAN